MSVFIRKNIIQKWVILEAPDIHKLYESLNDGTQELIKQNKTFSPVSHSVCYNSDKKRYMMIISFEGNLDDQEKGLE